MDVSRLRTILLAQATVQRRCKFHHAKFRYGNNLLIVESALLDQALKIFNLDVYHRPEAARAHYKKGNVMKKMDQKEEAKKELDMALDIFNSIVPPEDRAASIGELDDEDFDHRIMFWSR